MSHLSDTQRAQVRACAVVMQSAADVLQERQHTELAWRLKTAAVAIYSEFPQAPAGELPLFDAELQRRIAEAVPVAGICGTRDAIVAAQKWNKENYGIVTYNPGEQEMASEASPSLLASRGNWDNEMNHSHL